MKTVSVGELFEECPEKHGSCENQGNCQECKAEMSITVPKHGCNQGDLHSPDNKWVRFSQHLKIIVLEKPCLPFVMDIFPGHLYFVVLLPLLGQSRGALPLLCRLKHQQISYIKYLSIALSRAQMFLFPGYFDSGSVKLIGGCF